MPSPIWKSMVSCSSLGCCWCRWAEQPRHAWERLSLVGGVEWAVGSHETCHPDLNWRSLIMWGCPVVNSPVFLHAVWPSCRGLLRRRVQSESRWQHLLIHRSRNFCACSWWMVFIVFIATKVAATDILCIVARVWLTHAGLPAVLCNVFSLSMLQSNQGLWHTEWLILHMAVKINIKGQMCRIYMD